MINQCFTLHTDPGHGWLEVTTSQLKTIGLTINDFSSYSYRSGDNVYLEEDCDAGKFVTAYKKKYHKYPECSDKHTNNDSFVRNLPPIGMEVN